MQAELFEAELVTLASGAQPAGEMHGCGDAVNDDFLQRSRLKMPARPTRRLPLSRPFELDNTDYDVLEDELLTHGANAANHVFTSYGRRIFEQYGVLPLSGCRRMETSTFGHDSPSSVTPLPASTSNKIDLSQYCLPKPCPFPTPAFAGQPSETPRQSRRQSCEVQQPVSIASSQACPPPALHFATHGRPEQLTELNRALSAPRTQKERREEARRAIQQLEQESGAYLSPAEIDLEGAIHDEIWRHISEGAADKDGRVKFGHLVKASRKIQDARDAVGLKKSGTQGGGQLTVWLRKRCPSILVFEDGPAGTWIQLAGVDRDVLAARHFDLDILAEVGGRPKTLHDHRLSDREKIRNDMNGACAALLERRLSKNELVYTSTEDANRGWTSSVHCLPYDGGKVFSSFGYHIQRSDAECEAAQAFLEHYAGEIAIALEARDQKRTAKRQTRLANQTS